MLRERQREIKRGRIGIEGKSRERQTERNRRKKSEKRKKRRQREGMDEEKRKKRTWEKTEVERLSRVRRRTRI